MTNTNNPRLGFEPLLIHGHQKSDGIKLFWAHYSSASHLFAAAHDLNKDKVNGGGGDAQNYLVTAVSLFRHALELIRHPLIELSDTEIIYHHNLEKLAEMLRNKLQVVLISNSKYISFRVIGGMQVCVKSITKASQFEKNLNVLIEKYTQYFFSQLKMALQLLKEIELHENEELFRYLESKKKKKLNDLPVIAVNKFSDDIGHALLNIYHVYLYLCDMQNEKNKT